MDRTPRLARIDGAALEYVETGAGRPLVFVHGGLSDYRTFLPHCELAARSRRAITYSQRYHGAQPWDERWPAFGVRLHADDLVALLAALDAAPADLVAWSYGGHVALTVAVERPDLVRRAYVYEPGVPSYVTDSAALAAFTEDGTAMFGPVFEAAAGGDHALAVRRLIDGSGGRDGYFDAQPDERRRIELDNARTIPRLLAQSAAPHLTCEALAGLRGRVAIGWGAATRPVFGTVSRAAAACIGGAAHAAVAGADHMWPDEQPRRFVATALAWLDEPGDGTDARARR